VPERPNGNERRRITTSNPAGAARLLPAPFRPEKDGRQPWLLTAEGRQRRGRLEVKTMVDFIAPEQSLSLIELAYGRRDRILPQVCLTSGPSDVAAERELCLGPRPVQYTRQADYSNFVQTGSKSMKFCTHIQCVVLIKYRLPS